MRGGSGNFGVVSSFEYRLHRVGPTITAGAVAWPFSRAQEVLRFFREFAESTADEVISSLLKKGDGGVIVVSRTGEIAMPYNTSGMLRGCVDAAGRFEYGVVKELTKETGK